MAFTSQDDMDRYERALERALGTVKALNTAATAAGLGFAGFRREQESARATLERLSASLSGANALSVIFCGEMRRASKEINAAAKSSAGLEASLKRLSLAQSAYSKLLQISRGELLKFSADTAKGLHDASNAINSHLSQWKQFFQASEQGMGNITKTLAQYNRGLFETGRYSQILGRSDGALSPQFWDRLQKSTTMTRQSFMEWNKQWHQLYLGVPMGTKALVEFRRALEGAFGYDPNVLAEMNRRFIEMSNTLPDIRERLDAIRNADMTPQLKASSAALKENLFVMNALGADTRQLNTMAQYVIETDKATKSTMAYEKAVQKRNQSVEKFNITVAKNSEQALISIERHMTSMTESVTKLADAAKLLTSSFMVFNQAALGLGPAAALIGGASNLLGYVRPGAALPTIGAGVSGAAGATPSAAAAAAIMGSTSVRPGMPAYGSPTPGTVAKLGGLGLRSSLAGGAAALHLGYSLYGAARDYSASNVARDYVGGAETTLDKIERQRAAEIAAAKGRRSGQTAVGVGLGTAVGGVIGGAVGSLGFGVTAAPGAMVGAAIGGGAGRLIGGLTAPSEETSKERADIRYKTRFAFEAVRQQRRPDEQGSLKMPKFDEVKTVGQAMTALSMSLVRDDERRSAIAGLLKQENMTITDAMMEAKKIGDKRLINDLRMLKAQDALNERQAEHNRAAMATIRHYAEIEKLTENIVKLAETWRQASEATGNSLRDLGVFGPAITKMYSSSAAASLQQLDALKGQHVAFMKLRDEMGRGAANPTTITSSFTNIMGEGLTDPIQERAKKIAETTNALREQQMTLEKGATGQAKDDATLRAKELNQELNDQLSTFRTFIDEQEKSGTLTEKQAADAKELTKTVKDMVDPMGRIAVLAKQMAQIEQIRKTTADATQGLINRAVGSHEGMVHFLEREKELAESEKGYAESLALGMATSYAWNKRIYDLTVMRRQEMERAQDSIKGQVVEILQLEGATEGLHRAGVSQRDVMQAMNRDAGAMASIMEKLGKADVTDEQAKSLQAIIQLYDNIMKRQIGITNAKREELEITMKVREGFLDVIDELTTGSDLVSQIIPDAQRGAMAIMNIGTMMRGEEFGGAMRVGFYSKERMPGQEARNAPAYTQRGLTGFDESGKVWEPGSLTRYRMGIGRRHGESLREQQAMGGVLRDVGAGLRGMDFGGTARGPITPEADIARQGQMEQLRRRAQGEPRGPMPGWSYPGHQVPGGHRMGIPGSGAVFQESIAYASPGAPQANNYAAALRTASERNTGAVNGLTDAITNLNMRLATSGGHFGGGFVSFAGGGSVDMTSGGVIPGAQRGSSDDTFATVRGRGRTGNALVSSGEYVIPAGRVNSPGGRQFAEGLNRGGDGFIDLMRRQTFADGGSVSTAARNPMSVALQEGSFIVKRSSVPKQSENRQFLDNFVRGYADGGTVTAPSLDRNIGRMLITERERENIKREAFIKARSEGKLEGAALSDSVEFDSEFQARALERRRFNTLKGLYVASKAHRKMRVIEIPHGVSVQKTSNAAILQAQQNMKTAMNQLGLSPDQQGKLMGSLADYSTQERDFAKQQQKAKQKEEYQEKSKKIENALLQLYKRVHGSTGKQREIAFGQYKSFFYSTIPSSMRKDPQASHEYIKKGHTFIEGLAKKESLKSMLSLHDAGVNPFQFGEHQEFRVLQAANQSKGLYLEYLKAVWDEKNDSDVSAKRLAYRTAMYRLITDKSGRVKPGAEQKFTDWAALDPGVVALKAKAAAREKQTKLKSRMAELKGLSKYTPNALYYMMHDTDWKGWTRGERIEELQRKARDKNITQRKRDEYNMPKGYGAGFYTGGPVNLDVDRQTAGLRFTEGGGLEAGGISGLGVGQASAGAESVTVRGGLHIDRLYLGGKLAATQASGGELDSFTALDRQSRL